MGEKEWIVGIAEVKVARDPDRLVAYGLGSCVGVTLYDRWNKIGGLAHVMLPSSLPHGRVSTAGKYADTALEELLSSMASEGADLGRLEAKLVGGANMFSALSQQAVSIGMRNVSAVRDKLGEKKIAILGEDVGGVHGRTMLFFLGDGRVEVRKFNQPVEWI